MVGVLSAGVVAVHGAAQRTPRVHPINLRSRIQYDTAYYSRSYVAAIVVVVAGIIRKRCPSHTGISVRGGI